MWHNFETYRQVRWATETEDEIDRAKNCGHSRIEDELQGVEWVLARSPEKGDQVGPDVYLYVNRRAVTTASLITLLYSYNDVQVEVLRIWIR